MEVRHADSGRHYSLCRQKLHLHQENSAGIVSFEEGGRRSSGSPVPNKNKVGKVTRAQLEEIAALKLPDLTAKDMDAAVRTIAGSARAAGIETEGVV